jgi:hypothetical protein
MAIVQRVRIVWTGLPGLPGYSNLFFSAALNPQDQIDLVRDAVIQLQPYIGGAVTASVDGTVTLTDTDTGQVTGVLAGTARTIVGSGSGDQLPPSVQGLVGFRTGVFRNGHEVRGRWNIPGMLETNSTGLGAPTSTVSLQLIAAGNILKNGAPPFVVYSPTHKLAAEVAAVYTPTKWAVLKSRRD